MLQVGLKCNRGLVRKNNEDACYSVPGYDVYVVADGVGGNNSGEIASTLAVETIADCIGKSKLREYSNPDDIFGFFTEVIDIANRKIYEWGKSNEACRGMATTVVMAHIHEGAAYITNVGDSRAYLFRSGRLKRITKDHTYVNELIDQGLITLKEAETHSQKNVITKALGAETICEPDFYRVGLAEGDIMLLCSDGLYGEIGEQKMAEMLKRAVAKDIDMNELCTDYVSEAIKFGGRDNITVVAIRI